VSCAHSNTSLYIRTAFCMPEMSVPLNLCGCIVGEVGLFNTLNLNFNIFFYGLQGQCHCKVMKIG
jgi:hypothetical protein